MAETPEKSSKQDGNSDNQSGTGQGSQPEFVIQRMYVKDSSFEAVGAPSVFNMKWEPSVSIDLNNQSQPLTQDVYEVILSVTVTVKLGEKTAFVAEVKQAGIFTVKGFAEEPLKQVLGSFCPNILFPYIRERISSLIEHGGFPALYLAPINFDALYNENERLKSQQQQKGASGGTDTLQ
ncbi:MAG: protein-export chaperone SecB [Gammaproteobacteria bacterium]